MVIRLLKRKMKIILFGGKRDLFLASIIFAGVIIFLFLQLIEIVVHQKKTVTVPNLISRPIEEAVELLRPLNLGLQKISDRYDRRFAPGTIIQQLPSPGLTVREGKNIRVILSRGGEIIFVPDLSGQSLRSAEVTLRRVGLALGEISQSYSLTVEKGKIIRQLPPAGTAVSKESLVNLVFSLGTPPAGLLLMPDFLNKDVSEALRWTEENNLKIKQEEDISSTLPKGTILKQIPSPDTVISKGSEIKFVVSGQIKEVLKKLYWLHYEVSQADEEKNIRIFLEDNVGERMIYEKKHSPGTKVDLPLALQGKAKLKIFSNEILVEERLLE